MTTFWMPFIASDKRTINSIHHIDLAIIRDGVVLPTIGPLGSNIDDPAEVPMVLAWIYIGDDKTYGLITDFNIWHPVFVVASNYIGHGVIFTIDYDRRGEEDSLGKLTTVDRERIRKVAGDMWR